jgi:hypothetical protein
MGAWAPWREQSHVPFKLNKDESLMTFGKELALPKNVVWGKVPAIMSTMMKFHGKVRAERHYQQEVISHNRKVNPYQVQHVNKAIQLLKDFYPYMMQQCLEQKQKCKENVEVLEDITIKGGNNRRQSLNVIKKLTKELLLRNDEEQKIGLEKLHEIKKVLTPEEEPPKEDPSPKRRRR